MKKETLSLLVTTVIVLVVSYYAITLTGTQEGKGQSAFEYNQKHCAQHDKVYVQKDPLSKGECMDIGAASKALIEIHEANINKGLK
jgi:hypothetical protein